MCSLSGRRGTGILPLALVLFLAACMFSAPGCGGKTAEKAAEEQGTQDEERATGPGTGTGGRVLLVIAPHDFNDREYAETREELEAGGLTVVVASTGAEEATGSEGTAVKPDLALSGARAGDYVAVAFIGGVGVEELFTDAHALRLARDAYEGGLTVGAICMAPVILARAGILEGRRATSTPSVAGDLEEGGAIYVDRNVVVEGRIVTGCGPQASVEFGRALAENVGR